MIQACTVCGHPIEWQGMLNPRWIHTDERLEDARLEGAHAGVYVAPSWSGCCGAVIEGSVPSG